MLYYMCRIYIYIYIYTNCFKFLAFPILLLLNPILLLLNVINDLHNLYIPNNEFKLIFCEYILLNFHSWVFIFLYIYIIILLAFRMQRSSVSHAALKSVIYYHYVLMEFPDKIEWSVFIGHRKHFCILFWLQLLVLFNTKPIFAWKCNLLLITPFSFMQWLTERLYINCRELRGNHCWRPVGHECLAEIII